MQIEQSTWTSTNGWNTIKPLNLSEEANFVLVFGAIDEMGKKQHFSEIKLSG